MTGSYLGTSPKVLETFNGVNLFQIALQLLQADSTVTGSWVVVGGIQELRSVKGTVEGSAVALRLSAPDFDFRIEGTLSAAAGSAFSGTFVDCDYTDSCSNASKPVAISFTRQ